MIRTDNLRATIKSLEIGQPKDFDIRKRRIIHNYTSDFRITEDMDFKVETVLTTENQRIVRVIRIK